MCSGLAQQMGNDEEQRLFPPSEANLSVSDTKAGRRGGHLDSEAYYLFPFKIKKKEFTCSNT